MTHALSKRPPLHVVAWLLTVIPAEATISGLFLSASRPSYFRAAISPVQSSHSNQDLKFEPTWDVDADTERQGQADAQLGSQLPGSVKGGVVFRNKVLHGRLGRLEVVEISLEVRDRHVGTQEDLGLTADGQGRLEVEGNRDTDSGDTSDINTDFLFSSAGKTMHSMFDARGDYAHGKGL